MLDEVFDAFLEEYQYQKVIGFCTDEIDGYSGFVFCTGDGKVYLPNAINRTIRSICADYNKEEESKAKEENRDPVLLPKFSCHMEEMPTPNATGTPMSSIRKKIPMIIHILHATSHVACI